MRDVCLPEIRCRLHSQGRRLLVIDPASELDPARDPRPDTLLFCAEQLATCARLSAGPSLLLVVDGGVELLSPLPPPRIPEREFGRLRDYLALAGGTSDADDSPPALDSAKDKDGGGKPLLERWYRQRERTLTGDPTGDFYLALPAQLSESSVFSDRDDPAATDALRSLRRRELAQLGRVLAAAAYPALRPPAAPAASPDVTATTTTATTGAAGSTAEDAGASFASAATADAVASAVTAATPPRAAAGEALSVAGAERPGCQQ